METNFNQEMPYTGKEDAARAYSRVREQEKRTRRQRFDKDLNTTNAEIDQTRLEYGEIAERQEVSVVLEADSLPRPVVISEHRFKVILLGLAEIVLYLTSIALLAGQLFTTLDLDEKILIAIIGLVFLLMAVILPLLLTIFFKVTPKEPESKEPVEKMFFGSLGIGILAFVAFSMTRATPDIDGVWAFVYTASLPVTELMAATAAACCSVMRKYFSWSLELTRRFRKLDEKAEKTRNNISKLENSRSNDNGDPIIEAPLES